MSTVPVWPPSLPQVPQVSNYKETLPSNLLWSDTDTGPAKVRRRGHSKPYTIEASYVLTTRQMTDLIDFIENTLKGGAICFDWPRPRFQKDSISKKVQNNALVRARFKGSDSGIISYSPVSGTTDFWEVGIKIEVFPNISLAKEE